MEATARHLHEAIVKPIASLFHWFNSKSNAPSTDEDRVEGSIWGIDEDERKEYEERVRRLRQEQDALWELMWRSSEKRWNRFVDRVEQERMRRYNEEQQQKKNEQDEEYSKYKSEFDRVVFGKETKKEKEE